MKTNSISKEQARKIILQAQLLDNSPSHTENKNILQIIETLGYVQIDTLAVINRAHHHILWTRNSDYAENDMHRLQAEQRKVFEYWGHAMSYLPMKDYRFYLPKMRKFETPSSNWGKHMELKSKDVLRPVLERIRSEGPLSAKDFKMEKNNRGTWWDWKPAKVALEFLFWKGELMIRERRNFHKYYDLRERVLPNDVDTTYPTEDERSEFLIKRALNAMGIASKREIRKFLQPGTVRDSDFQMVNAESIEKKLNMFQEAKTIVPLRIEGSKDIYYALAEKPALISDPKATAPFLHLLSPFDNLIIQRERIKNIFDFDYTIECYVPEARRRYGYFVLPILWNGNLVGRFDPKADKENKTLIIKNLFFEPHFMDTDALLPALSEKLIELARFNQCERVELDFRGKLKTALKRLLKKAGQ